MWRRTEIDSSVSLACTATEVDSCTGVDSWGWLNWVCQLKNQHAVQLLLTWVDSWGRFNFINIIFFQNTHPKILRLPLKDYKSSVLALEAFELELDKITILPLKYNKSFSKPKSLVTPQKYCNHQNQFMEQQYSPFWWWKNT